MKIRDRKKQLYAMLLSQAARVLVSDGIAAMVEARRARRMAALKKVAGIWSLRSDIPADGLEYQRDLRAEWSV